MNPIVEKVYQIGIIPVIAFTQPNGLFTYRWSKNSFI